MSEQPKILVVDDEQIVLDSAQRMLSAEGFGVRLAADAESALGSINGESPDIVISDIMLPGMSGVELMEQLHRQDPSFVVILTTGYSTLENAVNALRKGAFDFLPKPFTFDELLSPVHRARRYLELPLAVRVPLATPVIGGDYALGLQSWARIAEDGSATLGLTRFLAATIGRIESIELPDLDAELGQGGRMVSCVSAERLVHAVWSPLSGRVIEVHEALRHSPEFPIDAPPSQRWLVRIIPSELEKELPNLSPR